MRARLSWLVPCCAGLAGACGGGGSDVSTSVPPVAAFGSSCTGLTCRFTDNSTDEDGRIAGYRWRFGDGTSSDTGADVIHAYRAAGRYTAALSITDDAGQSDSTTRVIEVVATAAPVAAFGDSCTDLMCTFHDSSWVAEGAIVAYRWSFGDGSAEEVTRDARHTYAAAGRYIVVHTVVGAGGATASTSRSIEPIQSPNALPVASFAATCVDLTCTFGDFSYDRDGSVVEHHWTFGDGTEDSVASPTHTYPTPHAYNVALTVTDERGGTAGAERQVTVTPPGSPAIALSTNTLVLCVPTRVNWWRCSPGRHAVHIASTGAEVLSWRASTTEPWIVVTPTHGRTPNDMMVTVDAQRLGSSREGVIRISAEEASNSPQAIAVSVRVF